MSKKRRDEDDEFHDQLRVYRGVIPWSVAEHDWIITTFDERRPKGVDHLPFPEELADFKEEMKSLKGEELENIKDWVLFHHIFRQRYPKKLEHDAHLYRFEQINKFMQTHRDELAQLKLIVVREGKHHVDPQLMKALCTMMFDEEDFDESGEFTGNTFSFKEVVAKAGSKINKKEAQKSQNEEQGFRGMIPWSKDEFNWIMNQQLIRRQKLDENEKREGEYLPLKIQMMRQTGKKIDNFNTMALLNEIFHERYPNKVEALAHFGRYHFIFQFLDEYKNELIKEGFADEAKGDTGFVPELIDSLCILPYSLKETEETKDRRHSFLYSEVVARTRAKISARLN